MIKIEDILKERILFLDGAMGTMIQRHKLTEEDYRGKEFAEYGYSVKGNNDLLVITQPEIIRNIHLDFLNAGSDIIETNTFNASRVSMADYYMEGLVKRINVEAVKVAQEARDIFNKTNDKPIFIAGAIGPTNKTASMSPDVNNPGYRAITFDQLVDNYTEQTEALMDAGVDLILVETVFDTLNCKAALFAINQLKEKKDLSTPVMVSGTITDNSGRTLSGQTTEAFYNSVIHGEILSIGLNCALGADQMRPYVSELNRVSEVNVSVYPNAGLPNEFGEYDDSPEHMASVLKGWCSEGWLNIVGGCCGTTPDHIKKIVEECSTFKPRVMVK